MQTTTDTCIRTIFDRFVKTDGDVSALFPIKRLSHSFIIGGTPGRPFDPVKGKRSNDNLRQRLHNFKKQIVRFVDSDNKDAVRKASHYVGALDEQLRVCDRTDEMIDRLCQPFLNRGN